MKNTINTSKMRILGLFALVAIIGFSMTACDDDDDDKNKGEPGPGPAPVVNNKYTMFYFPLTTNVFETEFGVVPPTAGQLVLVTGTKSALESKCNELNKSTKATGQSSSQVKYQISRLPSSISDNETQILDKLQEDNFVVSAVLSGAIQIFAIFKE